MAVGTGLAAVLLLVVVPERQQQALERSVLAELESMAAAFSVSAQLAFAQQDLRALEDLNELIQQDRRKLQVAVVIDAPGGAEVLAEFPEGSRILDRLDGPTDAFISASAGFETDFDQGRVLVLYDRSELAEQMAILNLPLYLALAALVVIQLWIYLRLARDVVRPIIAAARFADRLGAGDFRSAPARSARRDEVGGLQRSLRTLSARLQLQRRQNSRFMGSLEAKVAERTRELQQAMKAKDAFTAGVSHELRTPLHTIIASLDLVATAETLPEEQSRTLSLARRGSRLLMQLINELLDFQRLSQREVVLHPRPTNLVDFAEEAGELAGALFERSPVSFHLDASIPRGLWVALDGQRVTQLLLNLVGNARKFTEGGYVRLTLSAEAGDKGICRFRCAVADTGCGMDAATKARLGEAFFQADEGLNRQQGGTGLGISIVKRILNSMGSALEVESEPGAGSTFSFTLDASLIDPPDAQERLRHAVSEELAPQGCELWTRAGAPLLRLLYVEDRKMNQLVMEGLCKRFPVELSVAASAAEGYELTKQRDFDLIITDIQMPGDSGMDFLRWLRGGEGTMTRVPVYACTANATEEALEDYYSAGFDGVLSKPVTLDDLSAFLRPRLLDAAKRPNTGVDPGAG